MPPIQAQRMETVVATLSPEEKAQLAEQQSAEHQLRFTINETLPQPRPFLGIFKRTAKTEKASYQANGQSSTILCRAWAVRDSSSEAVNLFVDRVSVADGVRRYGALDSYTIVDGRVQTDVTLPSEHYVELVNDIRETFEVIAAREAQTAIQVDI